MNIAIIGTRGIPNHYGGFEQFAEYLSVGLVKNGHKVTVYNSHTHPYKESSFKGVQIIHCNDPENKIGTAGQFIYDLNCILDTRKKNFDIILQLGYTSSSIWYKFLPKKSIITTNMDGLEWKRTKYAKPVQNFLQYAEKLAVKHSDFLISDSLGIKEYLMNKYKVDSTYIAYGASLFTRPDEKAIHQLNLSAYNYDILIARLEPENSIEIILSGVEKAKVNRPFLVVGNHETKYGNYLKNKFNSVSNIKFLGGIYDQKLLNDLRYFSNIYFHGHTVGGTNPSLLEAMASSSFICANDNIFNKGILEKDAVYFKNVDDVAQSLLSFNKQDFNNYLQNNLNKIKTYYTWENIVNQYEKHFQDICLTSK